MHRGRSLAVLFPSLDPRHALCVCVCLGCWCLVCMHVQANRVDRNEDIVLELRRDVLKECLGCDTTEAEELQCKYIKQACIVALSNSSAEVCMGVLSNTVEGVLATPQHFADTLVQEAKDLKVLLEPPSASLAHSAQVALQPLLDRATSDSDTLIAFLGQYAAQGHRILDNARHAAQKLDAVCEWRRSLQEHMTHLDAFTSSGVSGESELLASVLAALRFYDDSDSALRSLLAEEICLSRKQLHAACRGGHA